MTRRLGVDEILVAAPELGIASLVDRALHLLASTLRHRHPTADEFERPNDPRAVRRARRLIARAERTRDAIGKYTSAVRSTFEPDCSDDLPF